MTTCGLCTDVVGDTERWPSTTSPHSRVDPTGPTMVRHSMRLCRNEDTAGHRLPVHSHAVQRFVVFPKVDPIEVHELAPSGGRLGCPWAFKGGNHRLPVRDCRRSRGSKGILLPYAQHHDAVPLARALARGAVDDEAVAGDSAAPRFIPILEVELRRAYRTEGGASEMVWVAKPTFNLEELAADGHPFIAPRPSTSSIWGGAKFAIGAYGQAGS